MAKVNLKYKIVDRTQKTYALQLEDGYYYVGQSKDLYRRIGQHFLGEGAKFTRKHRPVRVLKVWEGDREQEMTLRGMRKYGIENVRGYKWCHHTFPPAVIAEIQERLDARTAHR